MTPASDTIADQTKTSLKRPCDVSDMTAMIFDSTMLRLLECGDIHLGTDYERELRDTIIACACARIGGLDLHAMEPSIRAISDLPIRLEREMESLLRILCVPRTAAPSVRRRSRSWVGRVIFSVTFPLRPLLRTVRNTLSFVASVLKLA